MKRSDRNMIPTRYLVAGDVVRYAGQWWRIDSIEDLEELDVRRATLEDGSTLDLGRSGHVTTRRTA